MQIAVFKLGGEEYALETSSILGINKMTDVTNVPCAPESIKGLINLRGSIVSVINPYVLLGTHEENIGVENIIIVETDDEILGIIVDKVIEVADIEEKIINDVTLSREENRDYIRGTINLGGHVVTLININKLLDLAIQ